MQNKKIGIRKTDFIQGNIACAEGAIAAGCKFFAGYPITPASEIAHHMSRRMFEEEGTFIQTEDEIAAIANIIGASWGGVKSMTATSGPGISLMLENIGLAVVTETPCVIVNVQRGGPSTGSPTVAFQGDMLQPKFGSHGEYQIIALVPSSPQEMFDFTVTAFNKAEKYRVPVFILADALVGHMRERVDFPFKDEIILDERKKLETYQGTHQKIFLDEEVSKKVKTIIVCENNLGQIYPFVKAAANGNAKVIFLPPKILGTLYKQEEILNKIKEVFHEKYS